MTKHGDNSDFWEFKKTIFGKKQHAFCYAGAWSACVNLCSGDATACYCGQPLGNVFATPDKPFPEEPIGKCSIAHCYNGHALLSMGLIPHIYDTQYGKIRDRVREDGTHWLQPELRSFFDTKLVDSNDEYTIWQQKTIMMKHLLNSFVRIPLRIISKISKCLHTSER